MKLLVDMNLSPSWVGFLASRGVNAVHWSTVGAPGAPDRELMEWARAHEHVVFTHDLDFSVIVAATGATGPSVIHVRTLDVLPSGIGEQVVSALRQYDAEITAGAIVTIDGSSSRVRILPIRRP